MVKFLAFVIIFGCSILGWAIAHDYAKRRKLSMPGQFGAMIASVILLIGIAVIKVLHSIGWYPD